MPEDTDGLITACRCGGQNAPTGKERLGPRQAAVGGGPYRVRSVEYRCGSCGRTVWAQTDTEDEPSESDA